MRYRVASAVAIVVLVAFAGPSRGVALASAQFSGFRDGGLVQAFDSVGKGLLGQGGFAAYVGEFEGAPTLVLDLSTWAMTRDFVPDVIVNAFPAASCRTGVRFVLNPGVCCTHADVAVLLDDGAFSTSAPLGEIGFLANEGPLCPLARPGADRSVRPGLVQALDALGKNLLGQQAFAARLDPGTPSTLILDIGTNSGLNVVVNVLDGIDPALSQCTGAVRLIVQGGTAEVIRHQFDLGGQGTGPRYSHGHADLGDAAPLPCAGPIAPE